MAAYQTFARNTVRRARQAAAYDYKTVHSIFNAASILHVSFIPTDLAEDPFPAVLPMLGTMCSFADPHNTSDEVPLDLYIHGHAASRLMKLPDGLPDGLPVCVSAAILDGIVLALAPFHNSCNYRSAVLHGYTMLVTDPEERLFALARITDGLVPERWDNSRNVPSDAEDKSTGILKVIVESASAKIRVGSAADDKKDLQDDQLTARTWTGVVPAWQTLGTPRPNHDNKCASVPSYMEDWSAARNKERERYAYAAIEMANKGI